MLCAAGVEVKTGVGKTGVVGLLRGKGARKTVALRADMDALPLQEANDVPYRSRNAGVMHACGHDGHTAMLLGAAFILSRMRGELPGNVKFLFQPAEEIVSGASRMIEDGALASPKADAIFAAHVAADKPFGAIALREGPVLAAADHFRIVVTGRGGHASSPDHTRDPLVPANQIYQELATVRRMADAFQPCVISICSFQTGVSYNVIPHSVEMRGTLRTFDLKTRTRVMGRMTRLVKQTAAAYSVEGRLFWDISCPVLVNDASASGIVKTAAAALGRPFRLDKMYMGSEDFAFYLAHAPGAFFWVGTRRGRTAKEPHSNRFDFDERVLPIGAAMLVQCAQTFLASK
jgi:amidohydrolase